MAPTIAMMAAQASGLARKKKSLSGQHEKKRGQPSQWERKIEAKKRKERKERRLRYHDMIIRVVVMAVES